MIDESYYPVTDACDWEPLRKLLEPAPVDGWMFMQASADGWRYYKHSTTRERLVVHVDGRWEAA